MSGIETVNFPAGTIIFKEGDQPDGVYFILSGGVEISRTEAGAKVPLAKLGTDAVFGEMALIDNQPRSATVTTIAPTQCMKGTKDNFNALMNSIDPEVKSAMQAMVTVVREKNKTRKAQMTQADVATLNALKQQAADLQKQIMSNAALLQKIKSLNPFVNGVFNSLLRLILA